MSPKAELKYQCPAGTDNPTKFTSTKACEARLKMIRGNPDRYQFSKCFMCAGPVPIEKPIEVEVNPMPAPQPAPQENPAAPANTPAPAPKTSEPAPMATQDGPSAPAAGDDTPPTKIVEPGENGEPAPLQCRCGRGPVKIDKAGRSTGACTACMQERVARSNATRKAIYAQAKRVLEARDSLAAKLPPAPARPDCQPLVDLVQARVRDLRSDSLEPDVLELCALLTALGVMGGIPGWDAPAMRREAS